MKKNSMRWLSEACNAKCMPKTRLRNKHMRKVHEQFIVPSHTDNDSDPESLGPRIRQ